ncbi:MAG: class I SAM-dependent methyltransferase [Acidimicrobiales bacterium]
MGRLGFESGSETYERARPDYPAAAVDHILGTAGITRGTRALDLAAGTGKLTRQLSAEGASCVALEPSEAMRRVFQRVLPSVPIIAGTAEMMPAATGSVEAVVVAQAFHWFDPARALPEIARVLRPGGWLALIWNERDESDPTMAELVRISKWDREQPYPMGQDFGEHIERSGLFGPVERTKFNFIQSIDRQLFVEAVASRSYVRVMDEPDRRALLDRVAELGARLDEPIAMPHITDLFCARALG